MPSITIALSDEQARHLEERGRQANLAPEELLRSTVEEWLRRPREDFEAAATYVLQKNAELYRRLA
jgi:hypothetical protein